jgi:GT2 family glycosyltransferase
LDRSAELAVLIPARDAAHFLRSSLAALRASAHDLPVLVIDDGSRDDTSAVAAGLGARVLSLPEAGGPAAARNAGARTVQAELLLFLDADCVPHSDVIERVLTVFRGQPDLVGLSGSYDAEPPERNFASLYMNLRHHFTHQQAPAETPSFWAGCGAVRRAAFLEAGGFDAQRFRSPSIEDVELATRLGRLGRLRFDPAIQVKHLKRWTLRGLVETEIRRRAVPWAQLLAESDHAPRGLNLRPSQRMAAALAPLALASPPLLVWSVAGTRPVLAAACVAVLVAAWALNGRMLGFFRRQVGAGFALAAFAFHQVHLVYSSAALAVTLACKHADRRRPRGSATSADPASGSSGAPTEPEHP